MADQDVQNLAEFESETVAVFIVLRNFFGLTNFDPLGVFGNVWLYRFICFDIIVKIDDDCTMTYPGGKGKCYQRLINLMPAHTTYIESHLGGGAVLRNKKAAQINFGIDADGAVIATWQQRYPNYCTLVHGDAVSFLEQYDYQGGELVYADPPYLPDSRRNSKIYRHEYSYKDHSRLLDVLIALPCMVMLSGYDNSMYELRLGNWRKATFLSKTHVDVRTECVWMNFPPPSKLHDASYFGETYRDRQTNKRRHQRLFDRFDRMEPIEREHVLRALNAQYLTESRPS